MKWPRGLHRTQMALPVNHEAKSHGAEKAHRNDAGNQSLGMFTLKPCALMLASRIVGFYALPMIWVDTCTLRRTTEKSVSLSIQDAQPRPSDPPNEARSYLSWRMV